VGSAKVVVGGTVLWFGLSGLFDGAHVIVLPLLVAAVVPLGERAASLGLLSFGALAIAAIAQPGFGGLSDAWRPRVTRLGFAGAALGALLLGLLTTALGTSLLALAIGILIAYVGASALQAAAQGLFAELFTRERRGVASGAKQFAELVGAAVAFVALARLVVLGTTPALTAVGGGLVVSYLVARLLVRERRSTAVVPEGSLPTGRLGVPRSGRFALLLAERFVFLLATYAVGRFLVYLVSDRLAMPLSSAASITGNLVALLTVVTALSAVAFGYLIDHRSPRAPVSAAGSVLSAAGTLWLLIAADLPGFLVGGLLLATGSGAFASANWAATVDVVDARRAGAQLGFAGVATWGAAAAAGLFGPLIDLGNAVSTGFGYVVLLGAASACFGVSAALAVSVGRLQAAGALQPS
jgi:MFS family permease